MVYENIQSQKSKKIVKIYFKTMLRKKNYEVRAS